MSEWLAVNINDESAALLRREKDRGVSATESVRRAIGLLRLITDESAEGARFFVERPDGERFEMMLTEPGR